MSVLPHVYKCTACVSGTTCLGTEIKDGCDLLYECREWNLGNLKEQ